MKMKMKLIDKVQIIPLIMIYYNKYKFKIPSNQCLKEHNKEENYLKTKI